MFSYEENEKIVNKVIRKCICESHEKQFVDFDGKTKSLNHEFNFLYKDGRFVISKDGKVITDEELDWDDDLNQIFRLLMRNTDFDADKCGDIAEEVYYGGEHTLYV